MNAIKSTQASSKNPQTMSVSPDVDTEILPWQIGQAIATSPTLPHLLNHLSRIVHDQTDCLAAWFSMPDETGAYTLFRPVPNREDDPVWPIVEELARSITVKSAQDGLQQFTGFQPNAQLVISPVGQVQADQTFRSLGVWVACFSTESQTSVRQNWLMSMIAQATSMWFATRSAIAAESRANQVNTILATVISLGKTDQVPQTCMVLCNQLRKQFAADLVAVSLREKNGSFRLQAISDVEQIDLAADWTAAIAAACAVGGTASVPVAFPSLEPEHTVDHDALERFCVTQQAEACISLPLMRVDGSVGASVLVVTSKERLADPGTIEQFVKTTQMLGAHVDIVARANRGPSQWLSHQLSKIRSANWTRNALLGLAMVAFLLCLPLPYRIACDCTIQPVKRRFLAAPYDGILDHANVKLGDVVSKGDVLAQMDGGNLRIELSGLQAELAAAKKKRDSALAQGEVAQSQIARSEMRRHQSRIDLLNERLKNLEIRSPIDGLVVAGDLEKAEGAPLEMGQTVFEVAPLDRMLVEVAIEQSEIGYARPGMPVDIKLNAFPFRSWDGTVKSICPSTEIVNDKAVFVAEVEIENEEMKLKPGMEGTAKVRTDRACLGWSLFHRPWESVRYWTVW